MSPKRAVCCGRNACWHEAARDAARQAQTPSGLGMDSASRAFAHGCDRLRADGLRLRAGAAGLRPAVPRHQLCGHRLGHRRPMKTPRLPIGLGQTISKPSGGRRACWRCCIDSEAAVREQGHLGRVLEIGTGCGYQAAVLSLLSHAADCRWKDCEAACTTRPPLSICGVGPTASLRLLYGDGRDWATQRCAPYDHIVAAAGGEALPPAWLEQLAVGGRLVAPMHDARRQPGAGGGGPRPRRLARAAPGGGALRPSKIRTRIARPEGVCCADSQRMTGGSSMKATLAMARGGPARWRIDGAAGGRADGRLRQQPQPGAGGRPQAAARRLPPRRRPRLRHRRPRPAPPKPAKPLPGSRERWASRATTPSSPATR